MNISERETSLILGVVGIGLTMVSLVSPTLRFSAILLLALLVMTLFIVLRFQQLTMAIIQGDDERRKIRR